MKSQKWYRKHAGNRCPGCGGKEVSRIDSFQSDGDSAWCTIECLDCAATWQDVYTLTGYERFEEAPICEHGVRLNEGRCEICDTFEYGDMMGDIEREEGHGRKG